MDKIDRVFDGVEHPERYSDEELEAMFQDPETCEFYDLMSKARDAFAPNYSADLDAEWETFEKRTTAAKPRFMFFFYRHAAAVIAGVVVAIAAVAAGIGISVSLKHEEPKEIVADMPKSTSTTTQIEISEETQAEPLEDASQIIVFKEVTLDRILRNISEYYNAGLNFKNEEAKSLRLHFKWNKSKALTEVLEMLNNFEQIKITLKDNTIYVE